jgi:hypothetical protein
MSTTDEQARAAVDKLEAAVRCLHDQDDVRLSLDDMQAIVMLHNWARDRLTPSVPTVSAGRPDPSHLAMARKLGQVAIDAMEESPLRTVLEILVAFAAPPTDDEILTAYEMQRGTWERAAIQTVRFFFGPVKS